MLYCILSGQEDSCGEVVVPWRESLERGFSHVPAVHGRRYRLIQTAQKPGLVGPHPRVTSLLTKEEHCQA